MENIHLKVTIGKYIRNFAVTQENTTKKYGKHTSQSDHGRVYDDFRSYRSKGNQENGKYTSQSDHGKVYDDFHSNMGQENQ